MTDEMLVEAVARAIHTADSAPESHPLSKCPQIEKYRFVARAALAALPPEMRAAGEMKRALEAIADWDKVSLRGEDEHGLRDIIRSITERARAVLRGE